MNIRVATPIGYEPTAVIVEQARSIVSNTEVIVTNDPKAAVMGAQVVYTDVWASMGQEALASTRTPVFQPYQVNEELLIGADSGAIVLHCLPAHREEEITDAAIEGPQSRIWDQAENRLHAQKALLVSLLGDEVK